MSHDQRLDLDLSSDACYRAFSARDVRFDGRVFIAVRTTGIYCRPICPARTPKRENVTFFFSAAAAQAAGFRPCLRCRPEISPDHAGWHGPSETVSRALALIEAGALDDGSVEELAAQVGVCDRQLRRLFVEHIGAAPLAVAQTRRVHLAKQLIHETNLTMTEVALASGFGSVRRFNETFQALFKRPPASLRRTRSGGTPDATSVTIRLPYRSPYDWDGILAFLAARAIPGVEVAADDRYARTIALGDLAGTLTVEPGPKETLRVAIRFPRLDPLPRIIARVRRVFDLAADPGLIGAHLAEDPLLAPLVAARPGLRAPGAWDAFELAVRAILGQQISVPAATRLAGRLVAAFGVTLDDPTAGALGLTHLFPPPERLAGADVAALGLMPGARAAALSSLAAAVAADPALLGPYRDLEGAVAHLRSLPGVGDWTAHYIAMRALREPDAFPVADVALHRAMADLTGVRPTAAELLSRANGWRPWRAYAAIHLWASLASPKRSIQPNRETERDAA
jgi:AraC family transcriptional regulator, regulatory protein of adaptative response / DNA-3-methyladenine glycosylase II